MFVSLAIERLEALASLLDLFDIPYTINYNAEYMIINKQVSVYILECSEFFVQNIMHSYIAHTFSNEKQVLYYILRRNFNEE